MGCSKVRYETRASAEEALRMLKGMDNPDRKERRVYWEWACGCWHITSQQLTDGPLPPEREAG